MITETITYTDHNGVERTDTLNFHISEAVLSENLEMFDHLQEFALLASGDKRIWSTSENQKMLDILKWFIRISYGVRTPDGSFDQDEPAGSGEVWKKFRISNAYNDFLLSLFRPDPMKAVKFMEQVTPKGYTLTDEQLAELDPATRKLIEDARKQEDPEPPRLAPGTRIVDGEVIPPPLRSVPEEPAEPKRAIKQSEADFMKERLSAAQYEDFMSTRFVSEDATE